MRDCARVSVHASERVCVRASVRACMRGEFTCQEPRRIRAHSLPWSLRPQLLRLLPPSAIRQGDVLLKKSIFALRDIHRFTCKPQKSIS